MGKLGCRGGDPWCVYSPLGIGRPHGTFVHRDDRDPPTYYVRTRAVRSSTYDVLFVVAYYYIAREYRKLRIPIRKCCDVFVKVARLLWFAIEVLRLNKVAIELHGVAGSMVLCRRTSRNEQRAYYVWHFVYVLVPYNMYVQYE
jgi:hypothetical protein